MTSGATSQSKGVLRLKGRIYINHIRRVTETSVQGGGTKPNHRYGRREA